VALLYVTIPMMALAVAITLWLTVIGMRQPAPEPVRATVPPPPREDGVPAVTVRPGVACDPSGPPRR